VIRAPAVTLGEVLRIRKEFIQIDDQLTYQRCRVRLHAQGIVLRDAVLGAAIKTKRQQVCRAGEFLVAEIDAKVGGFGIVPDDLDGAIVSSHYFLFEVSPDRLDPEYLGLFARTALFQDQIVAKGSTNYAAIRPRDVEAYVLPLPDIVTQRRIISEVRAIEEHVRRAASEQSEIQTAVEALRRSASDALFGRLNGHGYSITPLGDVAEIKSGVTLGRRLTGDTVTLPYLRVANVQDGRLDLATVKEVPIRADEADKWRLIPGDVLLTEGGDWDKLGRGTVWRGELPVCIHQNHIFRVRTDPQEVLPEYLAAQVGSPAGKAYFQSASKQTTNLASINQKQLRAFPLVLPPVAVQSDVVDQLKRVHAVLAGVAEGQRNNAGLLAAVVPATLGRLFGL
jgi:type I restriction enzyme, S subunit